MKKFLLLSSLVVLGACTADNFAEPLLNSSSSSSSVSSESGSGISAESSNASSGSGEPLTFDNLEINPDEYKPEIRQNVDNDCQPDAFDPKTTPYHLIDPSLGYAVGSDTYATMMIDGWRAEGDNKTVLPAPYSLTNYHFGCASTFSFVYDLKKNGQRYMLLQHIFRAKFSPDFKTLVLYDVTKNTEGQWQYARRILTIATKKSVPLPITDCTRYLADVGNDKVVTYGDRLTPSSSLRNACVWGHDGILQQAFQIPMQEAGGNTEASRDTVGVLPAQTSTFYHLTEGSNSTCMLQLQNILNPFLEYRVLNLPVTHSDSVGFCEIGSSFQMDLSIFTMNLGRVKYRVSASGRGDLHNDWGEWLYAN